MVYVRKKAQVTQVNRRSHFARAVHSRHPFPPIGDAVYRQHAGGGPNHGHRRLSLLALLTCLTGEGCDLHHLISSRFRPSACQLSVVTPFRLPVLRSGTAYQMTSPPLCPCQPSGAISRHTYSAAVTTLTDTARTYSGYSCPRGGVAA